MKVELLIQAEKLAKGARSMGIMALVQCERHDVPSPVKAVEHNNHTHCIFEIESYERDEWEENLRQWQQQDHSKLNSFKFEGDTDEDADEDA